MIRRSAGQHRPCRAKERSCGCAGTSDLEVFDRIQGAVILRASKDGRRVAGQWTTATNCGRGRGEAFVNFTPPTRVRPDGRTWIASPA